MKNLNLPDEVSLQCLFCDSTQFETEPDHPPTSGDVVRCAQCQKMNDFDAMLEVCKEAVVEATKIELERYMKESLKGFLK